MIEDPNYSELAELAEQLDGGDTSRLAEAVAYLLRRERDRQVREDEQRYSDMGDDL